MKNKSFYIILISIFLAVFAGLWSGMEKTIFSINLYSIYDGIGTLFLNALTLLVIPLVSSSIITGISQMNKEKDFGKIGLKTVLVFASLNFLAISLGWLLVALFQKPFFASAEAFKASSQASLAMANMPNIAKNTGAFQILFNIIPKNIFAAFAEGQILGIIFFSIIFGMAIGKINMIQATVIKNFFQGVFQIMLFLTQKFMFFLPLGVFCLIAKTFASTGLETLKLLGYFSLFSLTGLMLLLFVVLPLFLRLVAKVNPFAHYKAMLPAIITAFSTSSSSATLPITIECLEKNAKVSNKITSLVTPLATSVNLTGTAIFVFLAAAFLSKVGGSPVGFSMQILLFILTFLTTFGVAPIPSGCLVSTMIVLNAVGLPAGLIAPLFTIDRFLDMFRTTTNVFGTSVSTITVAKFAKEKEVLKAK